MQHAEHRVILAQNSANGSGGMDAKRLEFAQQMCIRDRNWVYNAGAGANLDSGPTRTWVRQGGFCLLYTSRCV